MNIYLHQKNNNIGNLEASTKTIIQTIQNKDQIGLHLFSELYLGGYPLQDLCLQKPFRKKYQNCLIELKKNFACDSSQTVLFGGLDYDNNEKDEIINIYNCVYLLDHNGLKNIYRKQLLPNYDIYDEKKYFSPGKKNCFIEINNHLFLVLICEDMWHSTAHEIDPVQSALKEYRENYLINGKPLGGVINLSASPFHINKQEKRICRGKDISSMFDAPFFYVNQVGLNDEILFDGQSFIIGQSELIKAKRFMDQNLVYSISDHSNSIATDDVNISNKVENTWETLFDARIDSETKRLKQLKDEELEEILSGLTFALNEYANKTNMSSFLVAMSGGIDSAVALAVSYLASKASKFSIEAVYMPSQFNSNLSYELSNEMCKKIGIKLKVINLKFIHQTIKMTYKDGIGQELSGLADENIQSRLRGNLIYARSNQSNAMVVNTSNKSELSVGYSTLYGDSVGTISVLGDLYKTEVYRLADFINKHFNNIIPDGIIKRAPSAELREDQRDDDNLPPYDRLDLILECLLSYQFSYNDIEKLNISRDEIDQVVKLFNRSEFKRKQFCPIIKLKPKSFGFGYRNPILKNGVFN